MTPLLSRPLQLVFLEKLHRGEAYSKYNEENDWFELVISLTYKGEHDVYGTEKLISRNHVISNAFAHIILADRVHRDFALTKIIKCNTTDKKKQNALTFLIKRGPENIWVNNLRHHMFPEHTEKYILDESVFVKMLLPRICGEMTPETSLGNKRSITTILYLIDAVSHKCRNLRGRVNEIIDSIAKMPEIRDIIPKLHSFKGYLRQLCPYDAVTDNDYQDLVNFMLQVWQLKSTAEKTPQGWILNISEEDDL